LWCDLKAIGASAATRFAREFLPATAIPTCAESLNRDFRRLENTGYFEDIKLTVEDESARSHGEDRNVSRAGAADDPQNQTTKGISRFRQSDILDRFKDRKVGLSVESQFDPTKIKKAEVALRELLAEHGRQYATVKATYEKVPASNAVILTFNVNEGPRSSRQDHHYGQSRVSSRRITPHDEAFAARRDP